METPVIFSAVRTPVGKFRAALAALRHRTRRESRRRSHAPRRHRGQQVDEVIMGNVVQAGLGQNPARQAAFDGGSTRVAAMTINKVCGSGLKAVALAAQGVQLGESEIVVAGGMESMSNCPYLLPGARTGYPPRRRETRRLHDSRRPVGCLRRLPHGHDRRTRRRKIQHLARRAGSVRPRKPPESRARHANPASSNRKSCPSKSRRKKGEPIVIEADESPREDTSLEALAKLRPAFKKDGTVTAGNAPGTNDGAAAVVVTSERKPRASAKRPWPASSPKPSAASSPSG